ncbi:hypothetical protein J5N97_009193 [Dioscorea zingiberensis]|uniref:Agglutinin domain-containing protein n=1 Tax=Dioscorea zingiberensis TaxID=325984 RepID=A0A9D5CX44_9LILI|nr:hypothetical protein J5N97_009193 [Dioscorea zingiberensis]
MAAAFTLDLPRFMVLSSNDRNDYMGYSRGKEGHGYLAFVETQVVSPYAKFEVERADEDGLVHIRSCQNNKYRSADQKCFHHWKHSRRSWITSTAKKPENDQSKESCTLFKPITVDAATNTFRIMHVQSGCYLCLWPLDKGVFSRCVLANYKVFDDQKLDIFKTIDWNSLVILPKYLAFKGDNGQYLCLRQIERHPYLQFSSDDIGDPSCGIREFHYSGPEPSASSPLTTIKFGGGRIGFGQILTMALSDNNNKDTLVYDEMVLVVAKNSATNNTQQSANLDVKLSYTDYRTSTWKTMHSLKLAMKANMDFSLPLIAEGKIDLSGEVQSRVEWGSTTTTTTILEVVHKIVVAPMTKVTVNLLATNGKCDVPFTFTQRDTLYNGTTVTTEVQGGTYTGSNYYNIAFQTKEEKI